MGFAAFGRKLANNAWRIPVLSQFLAWDYAREFAQRPMNKFRGVYGSFAEAERAIPAGERIGYDHVELVTLYRHRIEKACQSDYGPLYWLRGIVDPHTFIFDLGGHVGVSYYGWSRYLGYPPGLRWLVYDLPAIVRGGVELASQRESSGLAFTSNLEDGRDCNVFLAAGSLQYLDISLPAIFAAVGCRPKHLIVNKVPLYDGKTFVTVQSTGRAFHPYRIFNRDEFVSGITALGYRAVDDWVNREQHCEIPFSRGRDIDAYSGYYFVLSDSGSSAR